MHLCFQKKVGVDDIWLVDEVAYSLVIFPQGERDANRPFSKPLASRDNMEDGFQEGTYVNNLTKYKRMEIKMGDNYGRTRENASKRMNFL